MANLFQPLLKNISVMAEFEFSDRENNLAFIEIEFSKA